MCKYCCIIPEDVLRRLSEDKAYSDEVRRGLEQTARFDVQLRKLREQARKMTTISQALAPTLAALAVAPAITLYNCKGSQTLPGASIANPGRSRDATVKRAFVTTTAVADFYKSAFGRNSIDDSGMTMMSSVHYGANYNNAFWNGTQMTYGDGDGAIFVDFTRGNDVVCHELTHGVTQFSLQLNYANEAGGLNESMSDVFGSMFRQWSAKQTVAKADWLIGKDIMGPRAIAQGLTCLRDMAEPGAAHCLAPQPDHFKKYKPGMDPHYSSGIPNSAFYKIATALGGKSWEKAGQVWYQSLVGFGASPNLRMKRFADRTRKVTAQLYPGDAAAATAVDQGWKQVGL
jgi:Zn-dependent metalloprotease